MLWILTEGETARLVINLIGNYFVIRADLIGCFSGLYSIGLPAIIAFTASSIALNGTMNHSLGWRPSAVTCSLTPSNSLCINASNVEGVHIISSKAVGLMYDRQFDDTIVSSNFVSVDFRKMRTDSFQEIRTTRFRKIRVVR